MGRPQAQEATSELWASGCGKKGLTGSSGLREGVGGRRSDRRQAEASRGVERVDGDFCFLFFYFCGSVSGRESQDGRPYAIIIVTF
jgi:hypothetical protein